MLYFWTPSNVIGMMKSKNYSIKIVLYGVTNLLKYVSIMQKKQPNVVILQMVEECPIMTRFYGNGVIPDNING